MRILAHLRTHPQVSPIELAELWQIPVGNVGYHVRRLAALGLITLHASRQRRGAIEHIYKLSAGADANHLVRYMTEGPASRSDASQANATALLDATAIGEFRSDLERLFTRMRELEAATVTRTGVKGHARSFPVDVSCVMDDTTP